MPLQVTNPKHQFGNLGSTRVYFQAEELVGVYGQAFTFQNALALGELGDKAQHFAFQPLHVFQSHIQEVGAATGWVQYASFAKLVMEGLNLLQRFVGFPLAQQSLSKIGRASCREREEISVV